MRAIIRRGTGDPIDWDKGYPNLSRAHQLAAAIGEALGIQVLTDEYKGNLFVTNVEEIADAVSKVLAK